MNKWTSTLFQHFDLICTFSVCFPQYLTFTCSPFPVRTIYATLKHLLSSQLLGLMFQTALQRFHVHSSQFQKKIKVNYLLQIMTIHFVMRDINTHTHTHTYVHVSTFSQLGHIWCYSLHKGKTRTGELLNSSTNDIHFSKKVPLQVCKFTLYVSIHPASVLR
jgi:hypothetical protein